MEAPWRPEGGVWALCGGARKGAAGVEPGEAAAGTWSLREFKSPPSRHVRVWPGGSGSDKAPWEERQDPE